jgi:hypothetical protein
MATTTDTISLRAQQTPEDLVEALVHPRIARNNPYSPSVAKDYPELRGFGVRSYILPHPRVQLPLAAGVPTTTLVLGNIPHKMTAAQLRREVESVTSVVPRSLWEDHRRGRRALFRMKVSTEDVDKVLAWNRRILFCPEFVWVLPERDHAGCFFEAAAMLRSQRFVSHGLMVIEHELP